MEGLGASHVSNTVSYHGHGRDDRSFGFAGYIGGDSYGVLVHQSKGLSRRGRLTQAPPNENRDGKHNCHDIHAPFGPFVLCCVGKKGHNQHANKRDDAAWNHNPHALILELSGIETDRDKNNNVDS